MLGTTWKVVGSSRGTRIQTIFPGLWNKPAGYCRDTNLSFLIMSQDKEMHQIHLLSGMMSWDHGARQESRLATAALKP